MDEKIINFIFYLVAGGPGYGKNIWDYRPGVDLFVSLFVSPYLNINGQPSFMRPEGYHPIASNYQKHRVRDI